MKWFELCPARLEREVQAVTTKFPDWELKNDMAWLYWKGGVSVDVPTVGIRSMYGRLYYLPAFPVVPMRFEVDLPSLPPDRLGHDWHRYFDGVPCLIKSSRWSPATTADLVIERLHDWYFNYLAKDAGLTDQFADYGRINLDNLI